MATITPLVNIPSIDDPTNFASEADNLLSVQIPQMISELNTAFGGLSLVSTTDTSATSNAIGTGAKTFTVTAGKSFYAGMPLTIADTAAPSTNAMYGNVTSYSGTSLVMNIVSVIGSGTKTAWSISLAGAGGATLGGNTFTGLQIYKTGANIASAATINLSTATGNLVHVTGTTAISAVTMTAGQMMEVIYDSAVQLTYNGTTHKLNTGGANYTTAAGDTVYYFYDGTTVLGVISPLSGAGPLGFATNADYSTGTDTTKPLNSAVARARNIVAGTAVATTSGTSIDFTGIPTWAKRVTIQLSGVSTNGTSPLQIQLGTSGGVVATGYLGSSDLQASGGGTALLFTTGLGLERTGTTTSATVRHGVAVFTLLSGTTWVGTWMGSTSNTASVSWGTTTIALGATLDRLRLTTSGGVETFDAGSINILYE